MTRRRWAETIEAIEVASLELDERFAKRWNTLLSRIGLRGFVPSFSIRPARAGEERRLSRIEESASELFRDVGMDAIADAPPNPIDEYRRWTRTGRILVARVDSIAIGFVATEKIDGYTFVAEICVRPEYMGNGWGAKLLEVLPSPVSLSCFTDVPWNAPYYARLGFEPVDPETLGPGHVAVVKDEAQRFAPWPRCIMIRPGQ